jgi:hypothetical protein
MESKASPTVWEYLDATDTIRRGHFLRHSDYGGTDVTYTFHRLDENGEPLASASGGRIVDCVAGARLKLAKRIWP